MTSQVEIGGEYYLPFWILLEYLDAAPPDPFVQVKVLSMSIKNGSSPDKPVEVPCCNLMCNFKQQLIAHDIPAEFLIAPEDLKEWAGRIADWFRKFGEQSENLSSNS